MKLIYKLPMKRVEKNMICVLSILSSLVILITMPTAQSDQKQINLGTNVLIKQSKPFDVIYNSVAYKPKLSNHIHNKTDLGYWSEKPRKDRSSSLFLASGLGVEPEYKDFNLEAYSSLAVISKRDSRLSTNLQFKHDIGVHYKIGDGYKAGVVYNHFSNAGIKQPNLGRDFVSLSISLY